MSLDRNAIQAELLSNVAMVSDGGTSDILVEFLDWKSHTIEIDGASHFSANVDATAKSLSQLIEDSLSDTLPVLFPAAVAGIIKVVSGNLWVNTGGSDDGTGTQGFTSAALAPTQNSPRKFVAGDMFEIGRQVL